MQYSRNANQRSSLVVIDSLKTSMVTRASAASGRNNAAEQEGNNRRDERLSTMHKDAIVMATAMANAPPAAQGDQSRSPPNAASAASTQKNHRELPSSPMVTPPIRSYNARKPLPLKGAPPSPPAAGVPHVYHDYSQVPDVMGYVRKKTGG